ncbi:MAG: hypothetical protein IT429_05085 [Gemmataceae bacterium]|nr:hypothetical protein [Gemmataceae bacterium]
MRITRFVGAALLAGSVLLGPGCRSGTAPLTQVQGKVTYRGQPVQGGTIVFAPDVSRGARGELACAEIQQDGSYTLKTGDLPGATVGWHVVTISSVLPPGQPPLGQPYAVPPSVLPTRYRDPRFSGLACEVSADRPNTINFQLD